MSTYSFIGKLPEPVLAYLKVARAAAFHLRRGQELPDGFKEELDELHKMAKEAIRIICADMSPDLREFFHFHLTPELEAYFRGEIEWFEKFPKPMQLYLTMLRDAYATSKSREEVHAGEQGNAIAAAQAEASMAWETMLAGMDQAEARDFIVTFRNLTPAYLRGEISTVHSPAADSIVMGAVSCCLN